MPEQEEIDTSSHFTGWQLRPRIGKVYMVDMCHSWVGLPPPHIQYNYNFLFYFQDGPLDPVVFHSLMCNFGQNFLKSLGLSFIIPSTLRYFMADMVTVDQGLTSHSLVAVHDGV